jgi:hypothetical protein
LSEGVRGILRWGDRLRKGVNRAPVAGIPKETILSLRSHKSWFGHKRPHRELWYLVRLRKVAGSSRGSNSCHANGTLSRFAPYIVVMRQMWMTRARYALQQLFSGHNTTMEVSVMVVATWSLPRISGERAQPLMGLHLGLQELFEPTNV